jgi:FkbM family methyltransferase
MSRSTIKSAIGEVVRTVAPSYWARRGWKRHFSNLKRLFHEQELYLAPLLCDKRKTSIDVGASEGIYTVHIVDRSRDCLAFEPRPTQASALTEMARCLALPVQVEAVALSDMQGEAKLRILERDEGRSTIERDNPLAAADSSVTHEFTVPTRRLDDYQLGAVGFVKIDVEGHELAVLRGGLETIRRSIPLILIEIEERHKSSAVIAVRDFLHSLDYHGYFILDRNIMPIGFFDATKHQDPKNIGGWETHWRRSGVYVNNFFFVPPGGESQLRAAAACVRSNLSDVFPETGPLAPTSGGFHQVSSPSG